MNTNELEEVVKACRYGALAAFVSAFITFCFALNGVLVQPDGYLSIFNDPFLFIEVPIMAGFGIGMLRKSRVAAGLALVYYIFSQVLLRIDLSLQFDYTLVTGLAIVFVMLFGRAFWGAIKYHNLMESMDPEQVTVSRFSQVLGTLAFAFFMLVFALGIFDQFRSSNAHFIFVDDEILDSDYELLMEFGVLHEHEDLLFFYPHDPDDYSVSGNFITNNRVVLYMQEEGSIVFYEIYRDEISSIELNAENIFPLVNRYLVYGETEDMWLTLLLSTHQDRHKKLLAEIEVERDTDTEELPDAVEG